ncbi:MAG: hypothetical protein WB870_00220 [Gallionellaceae bacterium]
MSIYIDSEIQKVIEQKLRAAITTVVPWVVLAIFLTAVDMHFFAFKFSLNSFEASLQASQGVLDGLPRWRIYQSRVLGPYLVKWIGQLFGLPPPMAYLSFIASCLLITKLIVVRFGLMCTNGVVSTLLMLVSGSLLFSVLLNDPWLYPWDMTGLVISTIFVVMVLRGVNWPWFIPLVAIAFLNRESGIFICVWMVAQGWFGYKNGEGRKPSIGMMVAGGAAALIGLAMIELLRNILLVQEFDPASGPITSNASWFILQIENNFWGLVASLTFNSLRLPVILYIIPLAGITAAVFIGIRGYPAYTALCLAFGVNLMFIFLFGIVRESRVMIDIIPFFSIFLSYIATVEKKDRCWQK